MKEERSRKSLRFDSQGAALLNITQQEDPVHQRSRLWSLDGASARPHSREKALVPDES